MLMLKFIKLCLVTVLLLVTSFSYASDYVYEKREIGNHVIHLVIIEPRYFDIAFVKANDGAYGRETGPSMAKRSNAIIAINGGFFEIGNNKDGMASGTLIIDGRSYSVKNKIQPLLVIDSGKLSIMDKNPKNFDLKNLSMLSGIPLLISDGKIVQELYKNDGQFYVKSHARTAIGITSDEKIIIAVIEHYYPNDKELIPQHSQKGLTILELAQLFKDLGCKDAINLDGGGSSTLWIDGNVVNQTIGDVDEGNNLKTVRAVSDAIVFIKR
jgi:exopolysaccharide biosynthesis protein